MSSGNDIIGEIFKVIAGAILAVVAGLVVVAGVGAVGGYALASALGVSKAAVVACAVMGGVAAPFVAGGVYSKFKGWKRTRDQKKWTSSRPSFTKPSKPAPAPQPAPQPVAAAPAPAADDTPPVFVDALAKMKEMNPDDRKKYLDRLRDAFPNEVETLHSFNDQMALAHQTAPMKKLTLVSKPPNTAQ